MAVAESNLEEISEAIEALEALAEATAYLVLTAQWDKARADAETITFREAVDDKERLVAVVRRNTLAEVLGTRQRLIGDLRREQERRTTEVTDGR